jgi:F-type H+-transporting ATPase subunit a
MAHLVPLGTPVVLIPLIVLIELVRNFIRPITLRVRLMANMVAGHLLLTLIRGRITGGGELVFLSVFLVLLCFVVLESGVALIQRYVFSMLSSLYLRERNKRNFYYL